MRLSASRMSIVLTVIVWTCRSVSHAFVYPSLIATRPVIMPPPPPSSSSSSSPSCTTTSSSLCQSTRSNDSPSSSPSNTINVEDIKADIERMRQEALQRLETLNEQMHKAEQAWKDQKDLEEKRVDEGSAYAEGNIPALLVGAVVEKSAAVTSMSNNKEVSSSRTTSLATTGVPLPHATEQIHAFDETSECEALLKARMERDKMHFVQDDDKNNNNDQASVVPLDRQPFPLKDLSLTKSSLKLLDETRWRLMLNIGREQGTWMPKTWGASGDRLRLHMELEFSSDQLYERDEFLNGVSGAKVLKVIHSEAQVSPTLTQGGRSVRLGTTGGWRVAPNEGPMGTSVLRFYVDLQEESRHAGSDVCCPAGRIYCTCGYFSMMDRHQEGYISEKDALKQEMRRLEVHYERLGAEQELDKDLVSWDKFQRSKTMMELRMRATKLNTKLHEAQIREPDRSLLRLSQDQQVGLTREGGVCCKVNKGLAIEYHILGKFEVASMTNREHSDYRELLP